MTDIISAATEFREGDEVVLAEGSYQGTLGVFLRLKDDTNWADINERDGSIRSHPVAWLAHAACGCAPTRELIPAGRETAWVRSRVTKWRLTAS